jgi:hypothetical protein
MGQINRLSMGFKYPHYFIMARVSHPGQGHLNFWHAAIHAIKYVN